MPIAPAQSPARFLSLLERGLPVSGFVFLVFLQGCSRPAEQGETASTLMPLFAHAGGCRQCHASLQNGLPVAAPKEKVCSTAGCHPSFREVQPFLHGPVALGQCQTCHTAHSSAHAHLLILPEKRLCDSCHARLFSCPSTDRFQNATCTTCHNAHGGKSYYLLRPEVADLRAGHR